MKTKATLYSMTLTSMIFGFAFSGCAEKKTRIWIEPPTGVQSSEKNSAKLYYQVEDIQNGKKENLIIPIRQTPENLVVENQKSPNSNSALNSDAQFASATRADLQISEGTLQGTPKQGAPKQNAPSVSYLRGLTEVEGLYQKNQYAEALVRLAPLVEQYPRQSRLFIMQGTLFRKIGEKKLALEAYKRAQKIEPDNVALEEAVLKSQAESGENL